MKPFARSKRRFVSSKRKPVLLDVLLMIVLTLLFSALSVTASSRAGSNRFSSNTASSCSEQAANFFFIAPYSARTDPSEEGGTVQEVAGDGFTALGLSYQSGDNYEFEFSDWLDTDLCLIYRLWPTRTVQDANSPDYYGPAGSLVRAANQKICKEAASPSPSGQPKTNLCEEIASASEVQMDIWVGQVEEAILQAISDPSLNRRIVAWYLGPEELRGYVPHEKELLQRIYKTVKDLDPLNRPAWMYNPNNASTESLVELGSWMDILSMGIYPHIANNGHRRIHVRHALKQMTSANALLGYTTFGVTKRILPVLEMFEDFNHPYSETDAALIPEFVRHDAYAAFANGADGILIFSMGFRPGFLNYGDYYDAWSEVAHQLTNLGLNNVFQHGQVQNAATTTVTTGQSEIDFDSLGFNETYLSLSVRDWFFEGKTYVLIVNSSEGDVGFHLDNVPPAVYRDLFTDEQHYGSSGSLELSLPPRGVILLASQSVLM